MTSIPLTLLVGIATGFFGSIPPGPLNVTVIRKASADHVRSAFRVAFGGAAVDTLICGAIGMGFGWALDMVVGNPWVKAPLALFLVGYGSYIAIRDRARAAVVPPPEGEDEVPKQAPHPGRLSFWIGVFQGASNPALFVNWTFLIGFFVANKVIRATPGAAAAFALGVGLGVFAWFALLIEMLVRLKNHPIGAFLRRSTTVAGLLLVAFGLYFSWKTAVEILPP